MINRMNRFSLGFLSLSSFVCSIFLPCGPLPLDCKASIQTMTAIASYESEAVLAAIPAKSEAGASPSQEGMDHGTDSEGSDNEWDRTIALHDDWLLLLVPGRALYPIYIADPRRPTFSFSRMYFSKIEIDETGDDRLAVRLGGRIGLLRLHKAGDPDHGLELDIEAGFIGQFDLDHAYDNIGWSGVWGFHLAWALPGGFAIRTGLMHDSSHVGDEYAERTGRQRIEYTREEIPLGLSWAFTERWRIYLEGAYANVLRNEEIMEPWRVQYGLEYVSPKSFWKGRFGWYAAVDVSHFEENDWDQNLSFQLGLLLRAKGIVRDYRIGVEYYDGRSQIGEFFQDDETYVAFGIWIDI